MPYAAPTKLDNNFPPELKSHRNTASDPNGSTANHEWSWQHPNIQSSFYQKLDPPVSVEDAKVKMSCHQHAVKDFDLQIEMNDLEFNLLKDGEDVLPYNESRAEELEQKKLKLLLGKRFHQNAMNAYWYYLAKMGK